VIQRLRASASELKARLMAHYWASELAVLLSTAVLAGVGGGFGAVVFLWLIDLVEAFAFGTLGEWLGFLGPAFVVVVPALGGLLVGPLVRFLAPEAEGHGVPEVMEAVTLRGGRIRPIVVIVKALASSVCIGTGGSAGRQGPIVQIGAAIGSTLGQWFKLSEERVRNMVACGAAAGVAAIFNTPIAGVFFSLEVILGEFSGRSLSTVVIAAVVASAIGRMLLGDVPALPIPSYTLGTALEYPLYLVLGAIGGLIGVGFTRFLYLIGDLFDSWSIPHTLKPAVGGLLVGAIGFFSPHIFGVGYEVIEEALHNRLLIETALALVGLKIVATSLTIGSGGSGGVFAPSLFIGAMMGTGLGNLIHGWLPDHTATPVAYTLVGMSAVFAAATRAPITAFLIIFEMTQDYRFILPLMLTTVVSTLVASRLHTESIYTFKLKQRGIDVHVQHDLDLMHSMRVGETMTPVSGLVTVRPDASLHDVAHAFRETRHHCLVVMDEDGVFHGLVTMTALQRAADLHLSGTVRDICMTQVKTAHVDQSWRDALHHFGALDAGGVPVLSRGNPQRLLGMLWHSDIICAYSRACLDFQEQVDHLERIQLEQALEARTIEITLNSKHGAVGQTLKELQFSRECVIVSIRRGPRQLIPRGYTRLLSGDRLIALATEAGEEALIRCLTEGRPEIEEVDL
jgi:CIC family chloride channel protein